MKPESNSQTSRTKIIAKQRGLQIFFSCLIYLLLLLMLFFTLLFLWRSQPEFGIGGYHLTASVEDSISSVDNLVLSQETPLGDLKKDDPIVFRNEVGRYEVQLFQKNVSEDNDTSLEILRKGNTAQLSPEALTGRMVGQIPLLGKVFRVFEAHFVGWIVGTVSLFLLLLIMRERVYALG